MAIRSIEPEDLIEVQFVPILIFGPPSCGKTTLAQTALKPCTLDLDGGIHRCANRKKTFQFDTWADVLEAGQDGLFAPYETLVIDTGGRAIDLIIPVALKGKGNNYNGALTPQGWGELGRMFTTWLKLIRSWKKQVVMICHQDESKEGDRTVFHPDLPGRMAWKEIHKAFDLIGQITYQEKARFLDFSPFEGAPCRKNAAHFDPIEIPDLHSRPTFLADLIAEARRRIGKTAAESAQIAAQVEDFLRWLAKDPSLVEANARYRERDKLHPAARKQIGTLLGGHAKKVGWHLDKVKDELVRGGTETPAPEKNGAATEGK